MQRRDFLATPMVFFSAINDPEDFSLEGFSSLQNNRHEAKCVDITDVGEPIVSMTALAGINRDRLFVAHGTKVTEIIIDD